MTRTVYEVQRDFALGSGIRSEIIWDSLSSDQSDILKQKIKILIPDDRVRDDLFKNIWLQRKYTNRTLLSAIIYVMVTDERNYDLAKESTMYTCHPVFRTRKCMNSNNSAGCCMVFIDENGRVYQNWNQYLLNNVLPEGTMIAPANGIYTFSNNDEIELEIQTTPKGHKLSRLLKLTDGIVGYSGAGGVAANAAYSYAIMPLTTAPRMYLPFALAVSAYSAIRSAMDLQDRHWHEQSLNDLAAATNWINVIGGVVSVGATGATQTLVGAANVGQEVPLVSKIAANTLSLSTALISGAGVIIGVYDIYLKYNDDREITGMDVCQLASSLLTFTHSVNNLAIAYKVSTHSRGTSVRRELGNQLSKNVENFSRKVTNLNSNAGKFDLIRTVNDIPLKDILSGNIGKGMISSGFSTLSKTIPNSNNNNEIKINNLQMAEDFGIKFVHHIANNNSLLDLLTTMAIYFSTDALQFLMNLTSNFMEDKVEAIDVELHTFIPTENVLYKILMHCVSNYTNFNCEFLESRKDEIIDEIAKYFKSLNPIKRENTKMNCKSCNGYYYVCVL